MSMNSPMYFFPENLCPGSAMVQYTSAQSPENGMLLEVALHTLTATRGVSSPKLSNVYITLYTHVNIVTYCNDCD
jgi:hypothetical protein